jgi:hypothetical protein
MHHLNKHTCNVLLEKQMKHFEQTLATYVYCHCNIPIYFCNIHMKHLQYTSETLETYACNMYFQQNLVGGWTEHCTAVSGCVVIVEEDGSRRAATWPQ